MRIHNIRPGVIGHFRKTLGVDYGASLRLCQLYGYVQHLHQVGHRFSQANYCRITGCHRATIRKDLKRLMDQGWIQSQAGPRGTLVIPIGIDHDTAEVDADCPTLCEVDGQDVTTPWTPSDQLDGQTVSTIKKERISKKNLPAPKSKKKEEKQPLKDQILSAWNEHRPASFQKLNANSLSSSRMETIAKTMQGAGGVSEFVERLPAVFESLKLDPFWSKNGRTGRPWTFENFFGTAKNPKQHLQGVIDRCATVRDDQDAKVDRAPLRFIEFAERWSQQIFLDQDSLHSLAVEQVRIGAAPVWALELIENWNPNLSCNEPIHDILARSAGAD